MKDVIMKVEPAGSGWWVDCDLPLQPTFHVSADLAEKTARTLAIKMANLGRDVRLTIANRLDETVATQRFFSL